MSVRAWKRVITLFVLILITALIVNIIKIAGNYGALSETYGEYLDNEYLVDLSEYGHFDEEALNSLYKHLEELNADNELTYMGDYKDLYVDNEYKYEENSKEKMCYLTFNDGPDADVTARVLDILKEYDVSATFFVVVKDGKAEKALYKRIVDEGHTIGVHSASHDYNKIYDSVDAFLEDFQECSDYIEKITGVKPEIFRFPGGSVNSYNAANHEEIIAEMIRRGYTYYDWNVNSGDMAYYGVKAEDLVDNVLQSSKKIKKKIVLFHDGSGRNAVTEALPDIIEGLNEKGYTFKALDKSVEPVCFGYY